MSDELNLKSTLERIDKYIDTQKDLIKRGKALKRLLSNDDFQLVILDGYIDSEAQKLFTMLTDPSGELPYPMETIHLKLEAISHLKGYIGTKDFKGTVLTLADNAVGNIIKEEDYRKEITSKFSEI